MPRNIRRQPVHRHKTGHIYDSRHKRQQGREFQVMNHCTALSFMSEHIGKIMGKDTPLLQLIKKSAPDGTLFTY
ncbi:hypothetical protein CCY01nite_37650 [Chitinophaga cymbidii]|uniref:Uncharacterized protein n=1 Tax=Chitinophaga cymbidii TaxID=1096750 RepID=A0A512RP79_9BACT|nr:hypothetical protein CCY01nite_37650 [Chitinophaga cymbidii]